MVSGWETRDWSSIMKGRVLMLLAVMSVVIAACAEPTVSGGREPTTSSVEGSETEGEAGADTTADTAQPPPAEPGEGTTIPETTTTELFVTEPSKPEPPTTAPPRGDPAAEPVVDPGLLPLVDQARADLAGRLGVEPGSITLVSAELVEWPDASLGCPQPGMVYAQIPADGSLIILSHGGAEYRYHTGGDRFVPFLCE